MRGSKDNTGTYDTEPKKKLWEKINDLKTHTAEAAFNEKVYLLLRALLKEEKNFYPDVESDKNIQFECNELYTTWKDYLDNDPNSDNVNIQLPQLKEAYLKCEPLVEKKLKKYTYEKGVKMAGDAKAKARQLRDKAIETARKTKEQILKQSKAFAETASAQYKNMSANLTSIAINIAEQTKHLSGVAKEEAIKRLTQTNTADKGLSGQEKQHMEDMMKGLVFNINIDNKSSSTKGGARLTRKRKRRRKRKKRKTRRNRKLN